MEIQNNGFGVKQFMSMIGRGTVRFDYPIQRAGGQWKLLQKSFLIHSLAQGYPIPPIYFLGDKEMLEVEKKGKLVEELVMVRNVLDGKQRLTNISEFINNEYKLDSATPDVKIDGMEYEIGGKFFEELDEEIKDAILSRTLTCYTIDANTATDEEIEDLFFRMNNGSSLTTQQKTKALVGTKWAEILNELGEHPLIHNLSAFSKAQIKTDAHLTALMQTMMMIDGKFNYKNVSQATISDYGLTFKEDTEYKKQLVEKVKEAMDFLLEVLDKKEKVLLKKVHFPMTLITALEAKKMNIDGESFFEWMTYFKKAIDQKDQMEIEEFEVPTNYLEYCLKGTTDKNKADGRMNEMIRHMKAYFENNHDNQSEVATSQETENEEESHEETGSEE
ncbi:DUF262 domain-containing protein [Bacillus paralicheniformis]|uniref:DUF262 domain-containing protein n=1 Tax=Bacillus paralicheniformis TaxID=1648923 RepID=UPI003D1E6EC0